MQNFKIRNSIKDFIKDLSLLFTEVSLYPAQHPSVIAQLTKTLAGLQILIKDHSPVCIEILEGFFADNGIPLYEIKHVVEKTALLFAEKHIGNIYFYAGLTPQELMHFAQLLIDKTKDYNINELQNIMAADGVSRIVIKQAVSQEEEMQEREVIKPKKVYGGSIEAIKLIYAAIQAKESLPMNIADKISQQITRIVTETRAASLALTSLRDYDEYTFTHSVNVAILSTALAAYFLPDIERLNALAKAAFLHDIGKILIPKAVLNKPAALTTEEWMIMKQHPLLGAKVLEQQEQVDKLSVLIAVQHHMKYDLSGYPQIEGIAELHPLSLIVNISDTYDALTSKRIYKKPLPADKALSMMMRLIGCDFDPQFFKIFTQTMGIYPPGTFVRLNTQEVAVINSVHPHALLLPHIKIILDKNGRLMAEPKTVDLANKQDNAVLRGIIQAVDPQEVGLDPLPYI